MFYCFGFILFCDTNLSKKHSLTYNGEHKFISDGDDNDMHIRSTSEDDCLADKVSLLAPSGDPK